ncbi:TPA: nodulation protein NfeD [Candidatus Bathyarchaeota archaeon]|nr:nodulation protein NfeD [Candidatus Bathyarchaeota archaeon]
MKRLFLLGLLALPLAVQASLPLSPLALNQVIVVKIDEAITPATSELVQEAYERGLDEGAQAMLLLLDTPGGQLDATMKIIEVIERSKIPWIAYVYPKGAKAWSAGTFIFMASHVAAMAPYALVGSAQPVSYAPLQGSTPVEDPKIVNALSAFITQRARMHGRNATAAELFVKENLNLNAEDALRLGVADLISPGIPELLEAVDGRIVETAFGRFTLKTKGAAIVEHSPSARLSFLSAVSNPIAAYLLFTIGLYALILGLMTPGYGAEVAGAVALILGLIGLGFNLNLAALILMGLGAVLMVAEAYTPGFGALGGAGVICLIIGSLLLIPPGGAKWLISPVWYQRFLAVAILVVGSIGGFMLFAAYKVLRAKRRKPIVKEEIVGETVEVTEDLTPGKVGFVRYKGEYWRASSKRPLKAGSKGIVVGKDGPILIIDAKEEQPTSL